MSKRVVITGLGLVTPLGVGVPHNFSRIINKQSGIVSTSQITNISSEHQELYSQIPSKVVAMVPSGSITEGKLDIKDHNYVKDARRLGKFSQYAVISAQEALKDAQWDPQTEEDQLNTGVCIGSCIGSFEDVYDNTLSINGKGYRKVAPLFVPKYLNNMACGAVSIQFGLKGFSHTVSTACATGSNAIGDAYRFLKDGYSDVCVAGATEAVIHPLALAGFARAKSVTSEPDPLKASRPFDVNRSGFVLGEGSGTLILETLDHAIKRGVKKIYGEIVGYGISSDAYHITSPSLSGEGAARAMKSALKQANLEKNVEKIGYVNAHATSTKMGDDAENNAIKSIFYPKNKDLVISSNKGSIGHLLGGAGAVEAAFTLLAMSNSTIPPTLNLEKPGNSEGKNDDYVFNYAANESVKKKFDYAMSNSFGFGGVNASLVFKKFQL